MYVFHSLFPLWSGQIKRLRKSPFTRHWTRLAFLQRHISGRTGRGNTQLERVRFSICPPVLFEANEVRLKWFTKLKIRTNEGAHYMKSSWLLLNPRQLVFQKTAVGHLSEAWLLLKQETYPFSCQRWSSTKRGNVLFLCQSCFGNKPSGHRSGYKKLSWLDGKPISFLIVWWIFGSLHIRCELNKRLPLPQGLQSSKCPRIYFTAPIQSLRSADSTQRMVRHKKCFD